MSPIQLALVGLAICSTLFADSISAQDTVTSVQTAASDDRLAQITLDSLSERFAALEIQRPTLLIRLTPQHEDVRAIDRRRLILCEAVREMPRRPTNAWEVVSGRVVRPIEQRLAGLRIERHIMVAERRPAHDVRTLEGVIEALERRRKELLAPGGQGLCGASESGQR